LAQCEDLAYPGQRDAVLGELDDLSEAFDLVPAVAALAALGATGAHDLLVVEPSQGGRLEAEDLGDLGRAHRGG
jgi:hypothetical protein